MHDYSGSSTNYSLFGAICSSPCLVLLPSTVQRPHDGSLWGAQPATPAGAPQQTSVWNPGSWPNGSPQGGIPHPAGSLHGQCPAMKSSPLASPTSPSQEMQTLRVLPLLPPSSPGRRGRPWPASNLQVPQLGSWHLLWVPRALSCHRRCLPPVNCVPECLQLDTHRPGVRPPHSLSSIQSPHTVPLDPPLSAGAGRTTHSTLLQ